MKSIGMFKLPYSRSIPYHRLPKWFDEKNTKEVEGKIGDLFYHYLIQEENRSVTDLEYNPDDSHKKPDIFATINGMKTGIQITQLVVNEYLSKYNQAKRICEKIAEEASKHYLPELQINVQIYTPWAEKDIVPKAPQKTFIKLAKIIARKIAENIELLSNKQTSLHFKIDDNPIKEITGGFSLLAVPKGCHSNFFGTNNIFVDYGFDDIFFKETDIANEIERIYNNKNGGDSEILIIWADEKQLMNKQSHIVHKLKLKFKGNTTFDSVYFMTFPNLLNISDRLVAVNKII